MYQSASPSYSGKCRLVHALSCHDHRVPSDYIRAVSIAAPFVMIAVMHDARLWCCILTPPPLPPPPPPPHPALTILIQVPPRQDYTSEGIPVASLAVVLAGSGKACDSMGREQDLCEGVALFVPARSSITLHSTGTKDYLWVCFARSNLNYDEHVENRVP